MSEDTEPGGSAHTGTLRLAAETLGDPAALAMSQAQLAQAQAALLRQGTSQESEPSSGHLGRIRPHDGAPASNKWRDPEKKSGKG